MRILTALSLTLMMVISVSGCENNAVDLSAKQSGAAGAYSSSAEEHIPSGEASEDSQEPVLGEAAGENYTGNTGGALADGNNGTVSAGSKAGEGGAGTSSDAAQSKSGSPAGTAQNKTKASSAGASSKSVSVPASSKAASTPTSSGAASSKSVSSSPAINSSPTANSSVSGSLPKSTAIQVIKTEIIRLMGLKGLTHLTVNQNEKLELAADLRAKEIFSVFSHNRPDGRSCFTIFAEVGITYGAAGENIAYADRYNFGYTNAELLAVADKLLTGWWNSEGHRKNMENQNFRKCGLGIYIEARQNNSSMISINAVQLFTN